MIGSAEYTAPEQARGKAVFASDLYSLGVTCIHLLTGMSPFDLFDSGNDCWVWQDYLQQPVSDSLKRILNQMLYQATNQRYQSAAAILEDLSSQERIAPNAALQTGTVNQSPQFLKHDLQHKQVQPERSVNVSYEQGGNIAAYPSLGSGLQEQRQSSSNEMDSSSADLEALNSALDSAKRFFILLYQMSRGLRLPRQQRALPSFW